MAKWSGRIGFVTTKESPAGSGIHREVVTIKPFTGEVIRSIRRWQPGEKVNDDVSLGNQISVVATPYLFSNFYAIRFVSFMNSWWSVSSTTLDYPRINIEIGGLYNGNTTATPE